MAALVWGAWSPAWALGNKVDFDGINKIIYVHPEVTNLDVRQDIYSGWADWVVLRDNAKFLPAIRYTGYDPIGGGQYTGDTYFLTNGWKLSIDLSKVRVIGVLYSDNYDTAFYTPNMSAQYPATVSSLVNTVTINTVTVDPNPLPPTAIEVANAVWLHSFTSKLLTVAKFIGLK